jgi:hypothetical protein
MGYLGRNWFDEINQLLLVPHIWVRSLELHAGCLVIFAVWHSTNYNREGCIWQLWEVTCWFLNHAPSQSCRRSIVALMSLLSCVTNLAPKCPHNQLNPLLPNSFSIVKTFQRQSGLESPQRLGNRLLAVQGPSRSIFKWFRPWIMDRFFFSRNPATHTFFHLLQTPMLACLILVPNCFEDDSVRFKRIEAFASVLPKSNKLLIS